MTDSGPRKIGVSIELKPHAYDPKANPELFEGVLARRCIAFLIDLVIISVPVLFAVIFMLAATIATLGWRRCSLHCCRRVLAADLLGPSPITASPSAARRRPPSACG